MKYLLILFQFALLLMGYSVFLNQWVAPNTFAYLNLIPLVFPVIFIINVCLLLFWWLYKWKLGLLFTILSIGLLYPLNHTFHIFGKPETDHSNLKIMTYNVHYFKDNRSEIIAMHNLNKPDIIFWQESNSGYRDVINQLNYLDEPYFKRFRSQVIISKYPIVKSKHWIINPHYTLLSYADIILPQDTVRFVNFYMESLYINQQEVKSAKVNRQLKPLSENLAKKAIRASKIHQLHIDSLLHQIVDTNHPVIMGGDMNSVPQTYEYYALSKNLKDPFLTGGSGLGTTFPSFGYPIRLDYIFIPPAFKTKAYTIEKVPYSDHYPVILEVEIP